MCDSQGQILLKYVEAFEMDDEDLGLAPDVVPYSSQSTIPRMIVKELEADGADLAWPSAEHLALEEVQGSCFEEAHQTRALAREERRHVPAYTAVATEQFAKGKRTAVRVQQAEQEVEPVRAVPTITNFR